MKKKLIKILSVFLTCAAISSTSAMAMTTGNVKENAEKTIGLKNSTNIVQMEKKMKKQFYKINKLYNTEKNKSENNDKVSTDTYSNNKAYDPNAPIALTLFGVYEYGDSSNVYGFTDGTISKSSLPLKVITYQEGTGKILSVKLDGQVTSSYTEDKTAVATNDYRVVTAWADVLTFNKSAISNLSNGTHTIEITCSSENKYTTGGTELTDNFSFKLVD